MTALSDESSLTSNEFPFVRTDPTELSPTLMRLRAEGPVAPIALPNGTDGWLVTGVDAIKRVLSCPEFSCEEATKDRGSSFLPFVNKYRTLLSLDPPRHTRARKLVANLIGPAAARELTPQIERIAHDLADAMIEKGGPVDIVSEFTAPITERTMAVLTGLPLNVAQELHRLFDVAMNINSFQSETILESFERLDARIHEIIVERRRNPQNDLLSSMIRQHDEDGEVTEDELIGALITVLIAGISTPDTIMTLGLVTLLKNPDQWRLLLEDPSLFDSAVEEVLRYCPPVETEHVRVTTQAVTLEGVDVPSGCPVLTSVAAANHDPERFEDPARFDITRSTNPHLTFGHGVHACPGNSVARALLKTVFLVIQERFPGLRLVEQPEDLQTRFAGIHSVGLKSVMVTW